MITRTRLTVRARPVRCLAGTLAATTVAALLAGCGSSGGSSPTAGASTRAGSAASASTGGSSQPAATASSSPSAIDLCALLPAAQATAANHVAYDSTSIVHAGTFQGCQYHNAGKSQVDITSLDITLLSSPGCWAVAKETDGPGTAVPGVGDAAFGYSLGLDVKHGNRCLTIEGQTEAESEKNWGPDTVMARALLAKLP